MEALNPELIPLFLILTTFKRMPLQTDPDKQLSGNVLIAEDNEINRFVMKKLLNKWGMTSDFAENGEIAIEKIKNARYDVVFMDIQMPILDGIKATRIIRGMNNGEFKDLPIIALTATVANQQIEEIIDSGMNDYISKPFVPAELFAKLGSILDKEL